MDDLARAHVFVSGRVQGVFYRYSAAEEARARDLAGWVRNLPDGRVELMLQGRRPAVEEVIRWCEQGPPAAHVEAVEVSWQPPDGDLRAFGVTG